MGGTNITTSLERCKCNIFFSFLRALQVIGTRFFLSSEISSNVIMFFSFQCDIYADIGEVINGRKEALWEKTTVFKSVGKLLMIM